MTYSLHTLHADTLEEAPEPSGWARFASEIVLFLGFFVLAFLLLAFASYAPQDAGWTTSGAGGAVLNRAGRLGALLADLGYFLLGYSVWWCLALAGLAWARLAMRRIKGADDQPPYVKLDAGSPLWLRHPQVVLWVGLA